MMAAARLGTRLALATREQRGRTVLVVLAAALSSAVVLAVVATTQAETAAAMGLYHRDELARLTGAVTIAAMLPVLALAGTVGRLSAAVGDRRLASLRLLGMTSGQTRWVAAFESGVAAVVGAAAGAVLFLVLRPTLAGLGDEDPGVAADALQPGVLGWSLAIAGVPLAVLLVASLPRRGDIASALAAARDFDDRRPVLWRVAPLTLGLACCGFVWLLAAVTEYGSSTGIASAMLFAGVFLVGIGIVVLLPVLVRLIGDVVLRHASGSVGLLTGRRLQSHPAGVARMVAALMVGLFLVTGARAVIGAFEDTPQYRTAAAELASGQRARVSVPAGEGDAVQARLAGLVTVDSAPLPEVIARVPGSNDTGSAIVGTCADLAQLAPTVRGCVDGRPLWLPPVALAASDRPAAEVEVRASQRGQPAPGSGIMIRPAGNLTLSSSQGDAEPHLYGLVLLVPPTAPGVAAITQHTDLLLPVTARPGERVGEQLARANVGFADFSMTTEYDFVAGLKRILWTLAVVILGLGLAGYAVSMIDRAMTRQPELTSLRLVGAGPRELRRAQFWETLLPTLVGGLIAIAGGAVVGSTYLSAFGGVQEYPWLAVGGLAAGTAVGALIVALLAVATTSKRIRPEKVRQD